MVFEFYLKKDGVMFNYHSIKEVFTPMILRLRCKMISYNLERNCVRHIKGLTGKVDIPPLTSEQKKQVYQFYASKGVKLKNTYWHRYYTGVTGKFHVDYVPLDFFRSDLLFHLNERIQWPSLIDKNLTYHIFSEFLQPKVICKNVNGFFFINNKIKSLEEVIVHLKLIKSDLVIKPTIRTGRGHNVICFKISSNDFTTYKKKSIRELLLWFNKDFIIQKRVEQSNVLESLNPTSLNTIRVVSYIHTKEVILLSSTLRIGALNATIDNFSSGGIMCGIKHSGKLRESAHTKSGEIISKSFTNISFKDVEIPNYHLVKEMIEGLHKKVPYFKIISWDIAVNKMEKPVFMEYNTNYQGIEIQIPNGPLFGDHFDLILEDYQNSKRF